MNILVNRKIKHLFLCVVLTITASTSVSIIPVYMGIENTALYIVLAAVLMASTILSTLYWYFQGQSKIMKDAISQIQEYIAGNRNARIACDDEGHRFHRILFRPGYKEVRIRKDCILRLREAG